ncbi:carboxypeptidase-like regulatory domain-containing protein [Maribacter sp. 2307ULW6-5]|uniref:carboxypeptidase-like regulatory domain-containing protein n=1 Tax=Maribacter sp. 2307ULW6-5 TaxID=3386275 RepID=UPI0039BC9EF0
MENGFLRCMLLVLMVGTLSAQEVRTISGKVSDGKVPMENVRVTVFDTDRIAYTDSDGFYRIQVDTGDEVQFSSIGMKTIAIRVEDVTRILNPIMVPDVTELDEVTVTKSKRRSQEDLAQDYNTDTDIIRTAFGYVSVSRSPGRTQIMDFSETVPITPCILDILRNRWPGVRVFGDCFGRDSGVTIRGSSTLFGNNSPVWDIDGLIVAEVPLWLDPNNVKRMAVLSSLVQTIAYGSIGANGVIVVNTIAGNARRNVVEDRARLRNNFYKDNALTAAELKVNWPEYKKELYASATLKEARETFSRLKATYASSPYFILDAQHYFVSEWDRGDVAQELVDAHFGAFEDNPVLLKALAYQLEAQNQPDAAHEVYKDIFLLRPHYAQSYLDLARSYRDIGATKQAAGIHARYAYLLEQGFMEMDSVTFQPLMDREFNNLLALEKTALMRRGNRNKVYVDDGESNGTLLVFEWNDGEAEFELQFVNPGKQYHVWKHTLADNTEGIIKEKLFGYSIKDELLDGSLPGTWQVNVNYLGNKSLTPTYLKATVYQNYGTKAQRKETKVLKLSVRNVNTELLKVRSTAGLTLN